MDKGNYNLVQGKKYILNGEEKTQWIRVGKFLNKDKPSIKLDVYPIPNEEGQVWLNIFPEDENEKDKKENEKTAEQDGDEIPF